LIELAVERWHDIEVVARSAALKDKTYWIPAENKIL